MSLIAARRGKPMTPDRLMAEILAWGLIGLFVLAGWSLAV